MRLAAVKPRDLIKVDDGLPYFAEVIERDGQGLRVSPITGPRGIRTVKARQVVDHYRHVVQRRNGDVDSNTVRRAGESSDG